MNFIVRNMKKACNKGKHTQQNIPNIIGERVKKSRTFAITSVDIMEKSVNKKQ